MFAKGPCKLFKSKSLISHLTNSNGCGNIQHKVLLTVYPFHLFLLPQPSVCPRTIDFYRPCFHILTNPSSRNPFRFTSIQNPGGVGRHMPFLPPDPLPCECAFRIPNASTGRAKAPFTKYLWNEHLQKCVKKKDFNCLQNEHLRKIRGNGAASLRFPLVL